MRGRFTDQGGLFSYIAPKLRIIDHCLPLWSIEGWDQSTGGFVERLGIDGRADRAAPRRVRVQARQIYCFAKAAQLGWYPEGREIAQKGLDYLLAKAKSPDGRPGFVHLLAPDGAVLNPLRDTYDHAFVLLALAALYQLDGDAQVRAEIDSLMQFFDTVLRSPDGGYSEGVPAIAAAPAKSADACVRGADRDVRRHPRPGLPGPRRRTVWAVRRQSL